ncbi:N-(5'-phosphoribosyl)anthranilate isomerase [Streptomyces sp. NPDC051172]|uniref:phosphoribosylanthranilate isomerase n=1 Tax=Streptomyces sp. NPDC051172 TaxID=3155796 RepID=UPI00343A0486
MTPPLVKACGATTGTEVEGLAAADLVGLWFGVPGGRSDLTLVQLRELAGRAGVRPAPVLVTLARDPGVLAAALHRTGVRWVQLHGHQPPSLVRALKRSCPATVIKALHLRGRDCLEDGLIDAYERAGTDCFVFDSAAPDGRLGSTGLPPDPDAVLRLADRIRRPFLLAGGITAHNHTAYAAAAAHPRFLGVDVDTAARGPDGLLDGERVAAVARGWRGTTARATEHTEQEVPR